MKNMHIDEYESMHVVLIKLDQTSRSNCDFCGTDACPPARVDISKLHLVLCRHSSRAVSRKSGCRRPTEITR